MDTEPLFAPVRLGAIDLKNRIVMAPLTRSRASTTGVPAVFAAKYYAQRASAGLVITEATQVSHDAMGYCRTPGVHTAEQQAVWRTVIDAVHAKGGKIVVQLWHCGRIAASINRGGGGETVAPSAIQAPGKMWTDQQGMIDHDMPRALETNEIAKIAADFANTAKAAVDLGFDGVEVHSANGYLLHQFLSSNVNRRTDQYGGSIENRVRMPLEVVTAILEKVPSDRVGVRISPGHAFNGIEETDMAELYGHYLGRLDEYGLAYLHVMRPFANKIDTDPVTMARSTYAGAIIACGGYTAETGAQAVATRSADAVAFGKDYISNPDLVERLQAGAALTPPHQATFYTPGEKGYTDYPAMTA